MSRIQLFEFFHNGFNRFFEFAHQMKTTHHKKNIITILSVHPLDNFYYTGVGAARNDCQPVLCFYRQGLFRHVAAGVFSAYFACGKNTVPYSREFINFNQTLY